jgi:hypothetical protein
MSSPATVQRSSLTKHLASKVHCVDDEIIGWLKRREQRAPSNAVESVIYENVSGSIAVLP